MVKSKIKQSAEELSTLALKRIGQEKLEPFPRNYELFYAYFEALDANLVHAIDLKAEKNKKLTQDDCDAIHQKFLNKSDHEEALKEAGSKVFDTVKDITKKVKDAKNSMSEYGGSLTKISKNIGSEKNATKIQDMVAQMMSETQKILERNADLEHELDRSTQVMNILQKDLENVRKEALTDSLTNVSNRKALDNAFERYIEESNKRNKPFSFLMIDIDNFKDFNDNFGHQVGDQVLRLVAQTLKEGIRGADFVCRYGGEEFAIILPDTLLNAGVAVGNNLRKTVAMKDIVNKSTGKVLAQITLSVGVAEHDKGESMENIIRRADEALYAAKNNGRNQVASSYGR